MSAAVDHFIDPRAVALIAEHGGDAEAALVACLVHIDTLAAALEQTRSATSWGYARGATRRSAAPVLKSADVPAHLDL